MSPTPEDNPHPQNDQEDGSWIDESLLLQILPKGATIHHFDVRPAITKGDNYLSVLYRTGIQYKDPGSDNINEKSVIVKGLPPGEFMQKYIDELDVFRREITMYSDVLPILYSFADSRLGNDSFKRFSASYYTCQRPDTLIFDDLKQKGYVMAPRRDRLDLPHAMLVVQKLACLHALSVAYEESDPGFLSKFEDRVFSELNRERNTQFIPPMITSIVETIRKWGLYMDIADKIERLRDTFVDKVIAATTIPNDVTTVLIHGDSWVNNFLFKYSDSGELIDLRFVDFQLSRQSSPAIDLQYLFFSSLRNEVRFRHYEDLVREYCKQFAIFAKRFAYSGRTISFEEIDQEIKRTMSFAFLVSIATLGVVVAEESNAPDLNAITEENLEIGDVELFDKTYSSPSYREAFEELLPYFDKHGVFD